MYCSGNLVGLEGRAPEPMVTALVVYDSWYGCTKTVADEVARGLSNDGRVATVVAHIRDLTCEQVLDHEIIVIGSPDHHGGPTPAIAQLIEELRTRDLRGRRFAFFDTCFVHDRGKVTARMETLLRHRNPFVSSPFLGLSVVVKPPRGPLLPGELSKCRELGRSIRTSLPISA
jgi:flavorubredoxin